MNPPPLHHTRIRGKHFMNPQPQSQRRRNRCPPWIFWSINTKTGEAIGNTAKTLLLWRHGQTDCSAALHIQGQIDIPLNVTGVAQTEAAAAQLTTELIVRIVSSPLRHAVATAQCVVKLLSLLVETDACLQERGFSQWEGLTGRGIKAGWSDDFTS